MSTIKNIYLDFLTYLGTKTTVFLVAAARRRTLAECLAKLANISVYYSSNGQKQFSQLFKTFLRKNVFPKFPEPRDSLSY